MWVFLAFISSFACWAQAACMQPGGDLGTCDESALLQRDVLTKSIDRHSLGHEVAVALALVEANKEVEAEWDGDPVLATNSEDALKALGNLQNMSEAPEAATNDADVIDFGRRIAKTVKCLHASSSCKAPQLVGTLLKTLSAGLTLAKALPELNIVASLGAIVLNLFFPESGKKQGPPALTLQEIGAVVKAQILDFQERKVVNYDFPAYEGQMHSLISVFGLYLASNESSAFKSFQSALPTYTSEINTLVTNVNKGWNAVIAWVQSKLSSLWPFSSSCESNCPYDAYSHWPSSRCYSDMSKAARRIPQLKIAAANLVFMGNLLALLFSIAHGVFVKFNQSAENNPQLLGLSDVLMPLVRTGVKVGQNILKLESCSSIEGQYANMSGTNMFAVRGTDFEHSECSDLKWYGHGWKTVATIKIQWETSTPPNYALGFFGTGAQRYHAAPLGYDASNFHSWWFTTCVNYITDDLLGFAGNENFLCQNLWSQFNNPSSSCVTSSCIGTSRAANTQGEVYTYYPHHELHLCARPDACVTTGPCTDVVAHPQLNFAWARPE